MRREFLAATPLVLTLWLGCNSLLGINDPERADSGAAGTAGVGGSAGAAGAAGADAGMGGTSSGGAAGTAGTSGSGGAAGSAGAWGDSGAPCTDTATDAKNCGWCGHDCGAFKCTNGECKAEEVSGIDAFGSSMVADDASLFITGGSEHQFERVAKAGGKLDKWPSADELYDLAIYNGFVYFSQYTTPVIYRAATTGVLAPTAFITPPNDAEGLAADDSGLYWHDGTTKVMHRSALDGSSTTDFVTGIYNVWYARLDATDLYMGSINDAIYRVAKNATLPVDGSTLSPFYNILGNGPAAMTLDQDAVYFSSGDPSGTFPLSKSELLRVTKTGAQLSHLAVAPTLILGIAVSDGYAYWVEEGTMQQDYTDGAVRRIKIGDAAASVETYATAQSHPTQIVVDATHVYWMNIGWTSIAGSVMRVPK
ncbi:MAG: hypothetical protein HY898_03345 [Deltaproteobacteria bacterium]|nr:hypothetical protein [Deltaproteobacteria bacterium]